MPTYVYRRADGTTFEIEQRITEPALEVCPTTGQAVKRVISGAGLIFKGSGFYLTDYARSGNGKSAGAGNGRKTDTGGEAKASDSSATEKTATETKSEK